MIRPALLLLVAPLLLGQAKPVLVPDVSQRDIQIIFHADFDAALN